MHSYWLLQVIWLALANQSVLFKCYAKVCFIGLGPGLDVLELCSWNVLCYRQIPIVFLCQTLPLFYFSFFSHDKYSTITINGVFGTPTWGSRMVGADESTELWRPPPIVVCAKILKNNVAVWSHWLEATTITTRFLVSLWSIVFDGGYEQCDLIGRFLKVFGVKFYYKSSAFWGFFAKHHFKVKTSVATLG